MKQSEIHTVWMCVGRDYEASHSEKNVKLYFITLILHDTSPEIAQNIQDSHVTCLIP